jgi:hypothetical protein
MAVETPARVRHRLRKCLESLAAERVRRRPGNAETLPQVIDIASETETETRQYPLRGYRAGAHARACRAALPGRAG